MNVYLYTYREKHLELFVGCPPTSTNTPTHTFPNRGRQRQIERQKGETRLLFKGATRKSHIISLRFQRVSPQ